MQDAAPRIANWKAPAEDGATLIWPEPAHLLHDTNKNARRLARADAVRVQNVPLPEIRRGFRAAAGETNDDAPLIVTGHQTELHHPGVWVKNVLIDALAAKLDGRAIHVAVDTDAPKHLSLRWPGGAESLTDDPDAATQAWSGLLHPPTPSHLRTLSDRFADAARGWEFASLVPEFLSPLARLSLKSQVLPAVLTGALHEADRGLGLRYDALLASPLWETEAYLVFAHHLLARADGVAADYNAALAGYRQLNKITSPGRPMPDLAGGADWCEAPFWLDSLENGTRARATLLRLDGAWCLEAAAGEAFQFDADSDGWRAAEALATFLARHRLRLSPRALTLTMVLRLLFADQFVHGIGGGQYDQVTDDLIQRHFDLEPPRFSVTTATLYFPRAAGRDRVCVPCVKQEGHGLKHSLLGEEKMALVGAIAAAPRRSAERRDLFRTMQMRLAETVASHPAMRSWEARVRETADREADERAVFDRELFYLIQPRARLSALIEQYRSAMR